MRLKKLKKAVMTVEAAVIVPLAAFIIAALIGYMYFEHERVYVKSSAYEAGFYALSSGRLEREEEEAANERLDDRFNNAILGFGKEYELSISSFNINVAWRYEILETLFGETFASSGDISVKRVYPVEALRAAWLLDAIT